MLEKSLVKDILHKFIDADFSTTYPHHFYKSVAREEGVEPETVRRICEGFSHKEVYGEVVGDKVEEVLQTLKVFEKEATVFTVEAWNEFSGIDYTKASKIINFNLKSLFNIYRQKLKERDKNE